MFAVIDTETTWIDTVMSIGVVISDNNFNEKFKRYYILSPEYKTGGMFSRTLMTPPKDVTFITTRHGALDNIREILVRSRSDCIFAYNARFDFNHLPELSDFMWADIMKLTRDRGYNRFITEDIECYASGSMKRGYGVEPMYKMICGASGYKEVHNALQDSIDELEIMRKLNVPVTEYYSKAKVRGSQRKAVNS